MELMDVSHTLCSAPPQVPAAALSKEVLAELVEEGEDVPEYIELEVDNLNKYYKVGDEISVIVLEYDEQDRLALTQFTDWEIEEAALEEDDEFEASVSVGVWDHACCEGACLRYRSWGLLHAVKPLIKPLFPL